MFDGFGGIFYSQFMISRKLTLIINNYILIFYISLDIKKKIIEY